MYLVKALCSFSNTRKPAQLHSAEHGRTHTHMHTRPHTLVLPESHTLTHTSPHTRTALPARTSWRKPISHAERERGRGTEDRSERARQRKAGTEGEKELIEEQLAPGEANDTEWRQERGGGPGGWIRKQAGGSLVGSGARWRHYGKCTIPRHVNLILIHSYVAGILLFAMFVVFLILSFFSFWWGGGARWGWRVYVCMCVYVCVYVQSVLWCFMPIALCLWDPTALPVSRVSRDGIAEDGSVGVGAQRWIDGSIPGETRGWEKKERGKTNAANDAWTRMCVCVCVCVRTLALARMCVHLWFCVWAFSGRVGIP